jgi:hypothetical protein
MRKASIKGRLIAAGLSAAVAFAAAAPAAATPALWYVLAQINRSVNTCVERARAALASEIDGKMTVNSPHVGLVNQDLNIAINYQSRGGGALAILIVAHRNSVNEARGVALNIRSGIQSGVFE